MVHLTLLIIDLLKVPSEKAGKYFVTGFVTFEGASVELMVDPCTLGYIKMEVEYQDLDILTAQYFEGTQGNATSVTGIFDLSVGDYLELYGQKYANGGVIKGGASLSYFGGFKLS